ncbi:MAG: ribonuclease P protein component [Acidobacteriota bacterium]
MSEHFPKSHRILRRAEFRQVYQQGRRFQAKFFTAFVIDNQGNQTRLGITTTRKMGNAVRRNRARRLLREVFRKNKQLAADGIDIVLNARDSISEAAYTDVESDFISFLKKAGKRSEVHSDISDSDL